MGLGHGVQKVQKDQLTLELRLAVVLDTAARAQGPALVQPNNQHPPELGILLVSEDGQSWAGPCDVGAVAFPDSRTEPKLAMVTLQFAETHKWPIGMDLHHLEISELIAGFALLAYLGKHTEPLDGVFESACVVSRAVAEVLRRSSLDAGTYAAQSAAFPKPAVSNRVGGSFLWVRNTEF